MCQQAGNSCTPSSTQVLLDEAIYVPVRLGTHHLFPFPPSSPFPSLPSTQAKSKTERKEKRRLEAAGLAEKEEEK